MKGDQALDKLLGLDFHTVLDIGSGDGKHAEFLRNKGKNVTTLDFTNADICGDFLKVDVPEVDLVWCCHVLEHQPNVGLFLQKILNISKWTCITVPPAKKEIVGGHLTLWNAGLLLYNLVLAGFDCSNAMIKTYGYNISVIVENKRRPDISLKMDYGDIETLSAYFPFDAKQGFNGEIEEINW